MALSDFLAPALQIGSTILSAGGQLAKGYGYQAIGARKKMASEFEAQQLEQQGSIARNVGQQNAYDQQLKTSIVNSLALARAAASGAGASDPTVLHIMAQTAGEGAYRQAQALYEGEAQSRVATMRAAAARYEGNMAESDAASAQSGANFSALATVLDGGMKTASMFQKYWPKEFG